MKLSRLMVLLSPLWISGCLITDSPYEFEDEMPLADGYWSLCTKTEPEKEYGNCHTAMIDKYDEFWRLAYHPTPGQLETYTIRGVPVSQDTETGATFFVQVQGSRSNKGFALKDRNVYGHALQHQDHFHLVVPQCSAADMRAIAKQLRLSVNEDNPCDITGMGYSFQDTYNIMVRLKDKKSSIQFSALPRDEGFQRFIAEGKMKQ